MRMVTSDNVPAFVFIGLVLICAASAGAAEKPKYIGKPPNLDQPDKSGPIGRELQYLCLRQLGADCRERLTFGADSYLPKDYATMEPDRRRSERDIRPFASLAFGCALHLTFGKYDEQASGIERGEAEKIAISLIQALASHHNANTDKKSWSWGDEWQSAFWAATTGWSAWLLWNRLPEDIQQDAARMVIHEADRFLGSPAPHNEFQDTKAEENAWNSQIMVLAQCMFPDHPNHSAWAEKAKEYMITAYAAPQDVGSERIVDGKPLNEWVRGPNVHEDYTLENHGFIHPDYLTAYDLQVSNTFVYRLAGEPLPEAPLFNIAQCRKVTSFLTRPSGWFFYPQWCDWSNYSFDVTIEAQMPDPLIPDPVGARCLRWVLDFLKYTDKSHGPGPSKNLFHGVNYACTPLLMLNEIYITYYLFGSGAQPVSEKEALTKLCGTMLSEAGKFAVCRSEEGMASFSWFDGGGRFMAAVTPLAIDAPTVPKLRSLVGVVGDKIDKFDEIKVVHRKVERLPDGGFSAGFSVNRGPDFGIKERLMMVALADGRVVYAEWFDSEPAGNTAEVRTGLIFLEDDPFWLRGKKPIIYSPGGVFDLKPERVLLGGEDTHWINYNNRLGIVLRGSRQVLLEGNQLVLNYRAPEGGKLPAFYVAVFYPNATKEMTAKHNKVVKINKRDNGSYELLLGDVAIALDPAEKAVPTSQRDRK